MNRHKMKYLSVMGKSEAKIYGVSWGKISSPILTRTDDAIGMVANAGVDAQVVQNDFDDAEIYKWIKEVTDDYGNKFIRVPRFWIEKTDGVGYKTWRISRLPFGNSYLPACFVNASYIDIGKYDASLSADNKLQSKTGEFTLINKSLVNCRSYAMNNGANYYQLDIHIVDILRTLFFIEFATLNSQSIMKGSSNNPFNASHTATVAENSVTRVIVANATAGLFVIGQTVGLGTTVGGNQIFSNRIIQSIEVYDALNKAINVNGTIFNVSIGNIIYSLGWIAGATNSVVAKSGSLISNSNGLYPCKYRGIENFWGNIAQYLDGVNINSDYQSWICLTPANYNSNLFVPPYEQLNYINSNIDGYIMAMGFDNNHPFAEFPTEIGGSSTTYYSDQYYKNIGQLCVRFGGYWSGNVLNGLSHYDIRYPASYTAINCTGRLIKAGI